MLLTALISIPLDVGAAIYLEEYAGRTKLISYMIEDPKKIAGAQHLTFVARYLERIGDHITNLCENVVFMATGERVELN